MFDVSTALELKQTSNYDAPLYDQKRLDVTDRTRTSVLPWRGQFSPELIDYLLETYASSSSFVVDPFCGSGTVLYEAAAHNMTAYSTRINQHCRFLSSCAYSAYAAHILMGRDCFH